MDETVLAAGWRRSMELYTASDAEASQIRAEHLTQLTRLTPFLMAANLVSAGLVGVALGRSGGVPLLIWTTALTLVAVLGLRNWWASRRRKVARASVRSFRRGTWHAAVLGLCWGVAPALWFNAVGPAERVLIATLVTGMLGAGAFALAMLPQASLCYAWLIVAGSLVALWRTGEPMYAVVALLLICYASVVSLGAMAWARQANALQRARYLHSRQQQVVALLLRDFEEHASDALWETDAEGRVLHGSSRLAELLACPRAELPGLRLTEWVARRASDSRALADAWAAGRPFRDLKLRIGHGLEARWWSISATPSRDQSAEFAGWRGVISDITESQRFEQELRRQAEQDVLTGLANRRMLLDAARTLLAGGRHGWLLSIDLDHFKAVNDGCGHSVGDEVLVVVARRLSALAGAHEMCARLGGDEFAILCRLDAPADAPLQLAQRVIASLSEVIELGARRLHVGASVGLARLDDSVEDVEQLMVNADLALYDAKRAGRGRCVVYAAELGEASRRLNAVELALRDGLAGGQFDLHFQPKVDAVTLRPVGVEALMRWSHPQFGSVSPGEFVPAAERCGLIHELGELALRRACDAALRLDGLTMAVNVSPLQLMDAGYVGCVRRVLQETGLAPGLLELEVTESVLLDDAQGALKRLHALRQLGVKVALDDFGTGFSSLAYLRSFPFDTLKIDRAFVRAVVDHTDAGAIIDTIVRLGRVLGMRVVAEGVETAHELAVVRTCGAEEVQGYLVSRPLPEAKLHDWLAGRPLSGPEDRVDSRLSPWRMTTLNAALRSDF